jgi:sporulation protein YlmC with PRC-barrel domain
MTKSIPNTSGTLVAATTVKGAIVYDLTGEHVGSVDHVMIDTTSGCAIYAVMSFGNSSRKGRKHHSEISVPWAKMKYDSRMGGYMVDLDKKVLKDEPNHGRNCESRWTAECDASWLAATAPYQDARVGPL